VPVWAAAIADYPRIYQPWGMFAPEPPYQDGRLVVDGRTVDGRKLDPLTGEAPEFDPHAPDGWGHDQFWCDYHLKFREASKAAYRGWLTHYLLNLHVFTGRPEDRLEAFEVWWVEDDSPPPGTRRGKPRPPQKLLAYGRVSDSEAARWLAAQGASRRSRCPNRQPGQRRPPPSPRPLRRSRPASRGALWGAPRWQPRRHRSACHGELGRFSRRPTRPRTPARSACSASRLARCCASMSPGGSRTWRCTTPTAAGSPTTS